jgi:RNA polymerase sigma-70 factor, ECF subfamily
MNTPKPLNLVPHVEAVWRYARLLTRSRSDADDLTQETLLRAIRLQNSKDQQRSTKSWLMTICRNCFLTAYSRRRTETAALANISETSTDAQPADQDYVAMLADVQRAVDHLSAEHAEIIHLITIQGLAYKEVSDLLGVPLGTVMSRLNRARDRQMSLLSPAAIRTPAMWLDLWAASSHPIAPKG